MKYTNRFFTIILFCLASNHVNAADNLLSKTYIDNALNQHAICMDGSLAIYYKNIQTNQKNWIIMLGGGVPCGTLENCQQALKNKKNMTSSKYRWNNIHGTGLLSDNEVNNPNFANWNKIFIPQCSMDVWVGKQKASEKTHGLSFQGGNIVHASIQALKNLGLTQADNLLMVGNSAGGIGVMNHIDWVASQLPNTKVKGLVDGSWVLDTKPFPSSTHIHQNIIKRLSTLTVQVDSDCAKAYPNNNWQCIMGEYIYPHIQSPLFVRISQTDPVHLRRLGISNPTIAEQEAYIHQHEQEICQSLQGVTYYFSLKNKPHTVVKNKGVFSLAYQGHTFYDAISHFILGSAKRIQITDCIEGNTK